MLALVLWGIALKREIRPTTVFLCSYSLIIFSWPYYDPRFWLPVIPLLVAYSGLSIKYVMRHGSNLDILGVGYLTMFVVMGLVALRISTMATFSGSQFPNIYCEQYYHSTYCAMFDHATKAWRRLMKPLYMYSKPSDRSFDGSRIGTVKIRKSYNPSRCITNRPTEVKEGSKSPLDSPADVCKGLRLAWMPLREALDSVNAGGSTDWYGAT